MSKKTVSNKNTRPTASRAPANVSPNAPQSPTQNANVKLDIYYHFKSDAYVDDDPRMASQLVRAGFYKVDRVLPRFEGKKLVDVVRYDGRPHDVFIAEIAKSFGFKIEAGMVLDFNQILASITHEFPFK